MNTIRVLQQLGLEKGQAQVYLALLELGQGNVADICKKTGLYRLRVYQTLNSLRERGFVTSAVRGRRHYYRPESPETLRTIARELETTLEQALPELLKIKPCSESTPIVRFFEGRPGLQNAFEDLALTLKKGEVFLVYSARKGEIDRKRYLTKRYLELMKEKGPERYVITNESVKKLYPNSLDASVRLMPRENVFQQEISQFIYADKIAFIDYEHETALIVQNTTLASFQRSIFQLLFKYLH